MHFSGSTYIRKNAGRYGGAIRTASRDSTLSFSGHTVFYSNQAIVGGAIYTTYKTTVRFSGFIVFSHNRADQDGGALYALGSNILIRDTLRKLFT